jgi:hypothetical protein
VGTCRFLNLRQVADKRTDIFARIFVSASEDARYGFYLNQDALVLSLIFKAPHKTDDLVGIGGTQIYPAGSNGERDIVDLMKQAPGGEPTFNKGSAFSRNVQHRALGYATAKARLARSNVCSAIASEYRLATTGRTEIAR